jgi:hypothetical protein
MYTCKSISINTASLRLSTISTVQYRPGTNQQHKSETSDHRHHKMNERITTQDHQERRWRITAQDLRAQQLAGAAHPDNRHEWYVHGIQVDSAMVLRRPHNYVPYQSMFQPDGRYAYSPNAPQYPQIDLYMRGSPRDTSRLPSTTAHARDTDVPMGLHYDRMRYANCNGYGAGFGTGAAAGAGGTGGYEGGQRRGYRDDQRGGHRGDQRGGYGSDRGDQRGGYGGQR